MMEPGTGIALEIPWTFAAFHQGLEEIREPALAAGFFADWAGASPTLVPLGRGGRVGYRVPLFLLGGNDVLDDLDVIGLEVYRALCGQLRRGTRTLPVGTSIQQVSIEQ